MIMRQMPTKDSIGISSQNPQQCVGKSIYLIANTRFAIIASNVRFRFGL